MVFPEIVTFAGKGRKNTLSRVKNFIAWEHLTFYSNNEVNFVNSYFLFHNCNAATDFARCFTVFEHFANCCPYFSDFCRLPTCILE